jgi:hypothetical protein
MRCELKGYKKGARLDCFSNYYIENILNNYFILLAINAFITMCGLLQLAKIDLIIFIGAIFTTFYILARKISLVDAFIILFTLTIAVVGVLKNYPYELWYNGVRYQLLSIIFFFIGESNKMYDWKLFDKAIVPILIVGLVGLILFITSPNWYVLYKMAAWEDQASDGRILEMTRLSAFWTYPYWVSYGSAIMLYYIVCKSYRIGAISKFHMMALFVLFLVIVLTQQRAPLLFASLSILGMFIKSLFDKKNANRTFNKNLFFFLLISLCALSFTFIFLLNEERVDFMISKLESLFASDGDASFLESRVDIFSDFFRKKITFWGDGIDMYSHKAYYMGKLAITDQQYLKILYETGYFGTICYSILFLSVIVRGLLNLKYCMFELGVVLFYIVAMSGANCLAASDQHCIIFWLCCGRIFNKKCYEYKKNELSILSLNMNNQ